ncbi:flagellar motor rotation protein MotB [Ichthyobacterium seriolicida]|uniref:Flagellar motor rotation protein MotB n=1 Tax=Ichthyobacterium seriolicida TaxID=242600 RepID=A0A1J1DX64_9FLAO|nr:flagellar motor rotation protein MotB [Ichthyobacterium seriolicida]
MEGCVSSGIYESLKSKHKSSEKENRMLLEENNNLLDHKMELTHKLGDLKKKYENEKIEGERLKNELSLLKNSKNKLQQSYNLLFDNNKSLLDQDTKKTKRLLSELEKLQLSLNDKEASLSKEKEDIKQLRFKLKDRDSKVDELERKIKEKEAAVTKLKKAVSGALSFFENKGLSVEERNGRVYISMENKLLFKSGSSDIDSAGEVAISNLAEVLSENPNIEIVVEGHTDDVPYRQSESDLIKDNWDLSVMRATSFIRSLLKNSKISPSKVSAAGRGKYLPLVENKSLENRAKNRRIEIILTPDMSKLEDILDNF